MARNSRNSRSRGGSQRRRQSTTRRGSTARQTRARAQAAQQQTVDLEYVLRGISDAQTYFLQGQIGRRYERKARTLLRQYERWVDKHNAELVKPIDKSIKALTRYRNSAAVRRQDARQDYDAIESGLVAKGLATIDEVDDGSSSFIEEVVLGTNGGTHTVDNIRKGKQVVDYVIGLRQAEKQAAAATYRLKDDAGNYDLTHFTRFLREQHSKKLANLKGVSKTNKALLLEIMVNSDFLTVSYQLAVSQTTEQELGRNNNIISKYVAAIAGITDDEVKTAESWAAKRQEIDGLKRFKEGLRGTSINQAEQMIVSAGIMSHRDLSYANEKGYEGANALTLLIESVESTVPHLELDSDDLGGYLVKEKGVKLDKVPEAVRAQLKAVCSAKVADYQQRMRDAPKYQQATQDAQRYKGELTESQYRNRTKTVMAQVLDILHAKSQVLDFYKKPCNAHNMAKALSTTSTDLVKQGTDPASPEYKAAILDRLRAVYPTKDGIDNDAFELLTLGIAGRVQGRVVNRQLYTRPVSDI